MAERGRRGRTASPPSAPPVVYAEASVRSVAGVSLFETGRPVTSETITGFYSDPVLVSAAAQRLLAEGFDVLAAGNATLNIAAPSEVYERVFRTRIVPEEREVIREFGEVATATFLDCPDTPIPGLIDPGESPLADVLEGVALNEPVYYFQGPWPIPPPVDYWHLDVPADVSLATGADRAHRAGFTGRGIRVVMVDSGWYAHPYFFYRGYRVNPTVLGPATSAPTHDEHGHGTGESANVFAVAPEVEFTMVKMNFVNSVGAFNAAVALRPHVISCSWGSSKRNPPLSAGDQALAAATADAVRQGIVVVFSAGNGHWGFPGQHPDVISAGGAFLGPDGSVEATPYASAFRSNIYARRDVPDLCGLVGLPPRAIYLRLPVEPGNHLDRDLAGGSHPKGDETQPNDGWAGFSGTSAAAPQLAGACALLRQACPHLSPGEVRGILQATARDVLAGAGHPDTGGHAAGPGPDLATGAGLVDAYPASMMAAFRCLTSHLAPAWGWAYS